MARSTDLVTCFSLRKKNKALGEKMYVGVGQVKMRQV